MCNKCISSGSQDLKDVDKPPPVMKPVATLGYVGQVKRVTQHQQEPPLPNPFPLPKKLPFDGYPCPEGEEDDQQSQSQVWDCLG